MNPSPDPQLKLFRAYKIYAFLTAILFTSCGLTLFLLITSLLSGTFFLAIWLFIAFLVSLGIGIVTSNKSINLGQIIFPADDEE